MTARRKNLIPVLGLILVAPLAAALATGTGVGPVELALWAVAILVWMIAFATWAGRRPAEPAGRL